MQATIARDFDEFSKDSEGAADSLKSFFAMRGLKTKVTGFKMYCGAGFGPSLTNSTVDSPCAACRAGFYKNSLDNSVCTQCGPHMKTETVGGTSVEDCVCVSGYHLSTADNTAENTSSSTVSPNNTFEYSNAAVTGSATNSSASATTTARMQTRQCVLKSNLNPATAKAASEAISGLIAGVVAANVAIAVGTAVVGSVAVGGVAGGGAGGGSSGGSAALISSVQFLNVMGRVGGENGSAGMSSFTEGFGWANYDLGMFGSSFGSSTSRRRQLHQRRAQRRVKAKPGNREKTEDCKQIEALGQPLSEECRILMNQLAPECNIEAILPNLEQCCTCAAVFVGVALLRALVALIVDKGLHKDVPVSLMFPCWEGPVFLTQYLGICDAMFNTISTGCDWHQAIGLTTLALVPIMFLFLATYQVRQHVASGDIFFEKAQHPGFKEVWQTVTTTPGCFPKFMCLRKCWNDWIVKGEWNDDTVHARRWGFLMGDYVGVFWNYCCWILMKKALLSLVLNLLDGKVNAFFSLAVQLTDSALLLWFQPFVELNASCVHSIGAITNLLSFSSICIPLIFDTELPVWMGDTFIMVTGMFATVMAAFVSSFGVVLTLFSALATLKSFICSGGFIGAADTGIVGVMVFSEAFANLKSESLDQLEENTLERQDEGENEEEEEELDRQHYGVAEADGEEGREVDRQHN